MIDFDNFCTIGNKKEYSTKQEQTVSLQPDCVSTIPGKTKNNKNSQPFIAVRSVEPIVPNFPRMSFSVVYFPWLLESFFSSLLTKTSYNLMGFSQKFILKLNTVNFNM